jgi:septal ring factor EnvC (AmiA/AmiB activator)
MLTGSLVAQQAVKAIEDKDITLKQRYEVMKSGSQTYEDYKVIKEFILDGFWKITLDSISKQQAMLKDANSEIAALKNEVLKIQNDLKAHQASVEEITFDSNHISVLGIPFGKGTFIFLSAALIAGLVIALFAMLGRMKVLNSGMKEKALIAHTLTQEFEEYKRKALEKQTKLSRELQNERNKIAEQRGQKMG